MEAKYYAGFNKAELTLLIEIVKLFKNFEPFRDEILMDKVLSDGNEKATLISDMDSLQDLYTRLVGLMMFNSSNNNYEPEH